MAEYRKGPAVDARVIHIARERFGSIDEVREALRRAVDGISDEQLRDVRGIQVLVMA